VLVLLARDTMIVLKHILVATDFSPASDAALTYGRALATAFGASLRVLHVAQNYFLRPTTTDPHARLAALIRRAEGLLTAEDRVRLGARAVVETSDHPADAIVGYASSAGIDLIVMGTHGRGAVAQVLVGSVAERVVRNAPCPVLTVKHPEHEFVHPDASAVVRATPTATEAMPSQQGVRPS
jgi:nucleotide-binding universal stress UspA family protein